MLGAIIGDIVGSRFEWNNHRSKKFELFTPFCFPTDDSIMSLAIAQAVLDCDRDTDKVSECAVRRMQELGRIYPDAGYGGRFIYWLDEQNPQPYNSWGNGAAMRVSACGFAAKTLKEAKLLSQKVTEVTHNHPEGIKGAEATTVAIFMARTGSSMQEIQEVINRDYYQINFRLDDIRDSYLFNESCQGTVPQALEAFFESTGFEDAIRNAISIGGDSDTLAAITGGIAEAYYGIPDDIRNEALSFLDDRQFGILNAFESRYGIITDKKPKDLKYYVVYNTLYCAHQREAYRYQLSDNQWVPCDYITCIEDYLQGFDPSEPVGSPYRFNNPSITDEIEEISEREAGERFGPEAIAKARKLF